MRLKRFELLTHGLEGRCSIQLSYRRIRYALQIVERVMGIGPTRPAWKAGILPLNYTRISSHFTVASSTLVYNSIKKLNCQIFFRGFFKKNQIFFTLTKIYKKCEIFSCIFPLKEFFSTLVIKKRICYNVIIMGLPDNEKGKSRAEQKHP